MNNLYYNNKRLKKIRSKRTGRTLKIWGWILSSLGGITVLSCLLDLMTGGGLDGLASGLLFLVPGIILLTMAHRRVARWDQYEALIDNQGNTSIPMLAERMHLPAKTVYSDLQAMILNDFFIGPNNNIEAYIDGERDMLVMCMGGRPMKPLPDVKPAQPEKDPWREEAAQTGSTDGNWQDTEDIPDAEWKDEPIEVKMTDLEVIQQAIANTREDDVRNSLYGLEGSFRRIDARVQTNPELKKKSSIRNLYRYYLPQVMELIRRYQSPDTSEESRAQLRKGLQLSAEALSHIEADLMEKDQMDIEVDIEVLKNMFVRDGLLRGEAQAQPKAQAQAKPQPQVQAQPQAQAQPQGQPAVQGRR